MKMRNPEAAKHLGVAPSTLKLSRHTGILAMVDAPRFIKIGRCVLYEKDELDNWLGQFKTYNNTSEVYEKNI